MVVTGDNAAGKRGGTDFGGDREHSMRFFFFLFPSLWFVNHRRLTLIPGVSLADDVVLVVIRDGIFFLVDPF